MKSRWILWMVLCAFLCSCTLEEVNLEDSLSDQAEEHGRYFGTAVVHDALFNTSQPELSRRYNDIVKNQFNIVVPESELKMANLWVSENRMDYTKIDRIADMAVSNGQKMRGHVLVWYRSLPGWLLAGYRDGSYSNARIAQLLAWYVQEVMNHFSQKYPDLIVAWDVVNEAIGPNDPRTSDTFGLRPPGTDYLDAGQDFWRLTIGDDYVEKVFEWAHQADPDARLFYNDYHCEYENPKGEAIYSFVRALQAKGVPIHGMGLQCHFAVSYLDMSWPGIVFSLDSISRTVDRWISTGLEIHITEVDIGVSTGQEARQSAFFAGLLRATLLKDGVRAFVTWGFTDLVSWRPADKALYFDTAMNPKSSYHSMLDVLTHWQ